MPDAARHAEQRCVARVPFWRGGENSDARVVDPKSYAVVTSKPGRGDASSSTFGVNAP